MNLVPLRGAYCAEHNNTAAGEDRVGQQMDGRESRSAQQLAGLGTDYLETGYYRATWADDNRAFSVGLGTQLYAFQIRRVKAFQSVTPEHLSNAWRGFVAQLKHILVHFYAILWM